ncbi:MAG: hypothetical protein AB7O04_15845 [Hyphomonadaceae bacterium]
MGNWITLAILLLRVASDLIGFIEREKARGAAERKLAAEIGKSIHESIAKAEAARAGVRADFGADPDRVRGVDDGFRRD